MQSGRILSLAKVLPRVGIFSSSYGTPNALGSTGALLNPIKSVLQSEPFLLGGVRYKYTKKYSNKVALTDPDAVKYPGFVYFPRHPDEKDPPIEPSKLFMVKRIRSLYGCPWWEKKWIRQLGLVSRQTTVILKNSPTANARLYRVKHLVEITPITIPNGMPDSPENGFLKDNGEFISYNLLKPHGETDIEGANANFEEYYDQHINKKSMRVYLHRKWYSRWDVV